MKAKEAEAWIFDFVIESPSGQAVSAAVADELFHCIVDLAEERGLQMGGGIRPDTPEEEERHRRAEEFVQRLDRG